MKKIRKGNTINLNWLVRKNESSPELSDRNLQLYLVDALKKKTEITDFTVTGDVISFEVLGKNQCHLNSGKYSLLLIADRQTESQFVLDKQDVFILLDKLDGKVETGQNDDNLTVETINLVSETLTGNLAVDLSRYYTKDEIDEMFTEINNVYASENAAGNSNQGQNAHVQGMGLITQNQSEFAAGQYNESNKDSDAWGSSGNTLFSVGVGSSDNRRKNAIEVMQNGDIIFDINGDKVKLQDIIHVTDEIDPETGLKKIEFVGVSDIDVSGFITEEALNSLDLANRTWVTQQLVEYITRGEVDLSPYVLKSELNSYNFAYASQITELYNTIGALSYITQEDLEPYATKAYVMNRINAIEQPDLSPYVSYAYLRGKKYVNSDDLSAAAYITANELPNMSLYARKTYLNTYYYDKENVNNIILTEVAKYGKEKDIIFCSSPAYTITVADIDKWNEIGIKYASKSYVMEKFNSVPQYDLTNYATKAYVMNKIESIETGNPNIDLTNYATKSYVSNRIDALNIPQQQDLTPYATKSYVSNRINEINIPDTSLYATKVWVNTEIENIQHPQPDLTPYATKAYVMSKIDELPESVDLSTYATKAYVMNKINAIPEPNLDGYATKTYVMNKFNSISIPSLEGYATQSYVINKINNITQVDVTDFVSYTYLNNKLNNLVTDETDPVFTASPAANITQDNINTIKKLQYNSSLKKIMFDSPNDELDGFLATENYVLSQVAQNSNLVVKVTRERYDFMVNAGLLDEHKIYLITDEDTDIVHDDDLLLYATKSYLNTNYFTKTEVEALLANVSTGGEITLDGYATENWTADYVASLNLANKLWSNIQIAEALQEAKDYADGIATGGVSLSDYVTKSYLSNTLTYYALTENTLSKVEGATKSWVNNNFATKDELSQIDLSNINTSSLVSKQELSQMGYLTEHQSLLNYATKAYVMNYINEIQVNDGGLYVTKVQLSQMGYITADNVPTMTELQNYVTKTYLGQKLSEIEQVDLTPYATKSWVLGKLDNIDVDVDLSNYYTKSEIEAKNYLTQHQSLDNYATKAYVSAKIDAIDLGSNISLSNYAEKEWVTQQIANINTGGNIDLSEYVTKTELNSRNYITNSALTTYATRDWVTTQITNISTGGEIDLSDYATKAYVMSKIANIPTGGGGSNVDLSNYYTKSEIDAKNYLTQHQSLTNYATKEYVLNMISENNADSGITFSYAYEKFVDRDTFNTSIGTINYTIYGEDGIVNAIWGESGIAVAIWGENGLNNIKADKSELYELDDLVHTYYATQNYVNQQINANQPDLSIYATKQELLSKPGFDYIDMAVGEISDELHTYYYTKNESDSKFATISYVTDKTNEITNDLHTNYFTKNETNYKFNTLIWTGTQSEYDELQNKSIYQIYLIKQ